MRRLGVAVAALACAAAGALTAVVLAGNVDAAGFLTTGSTATTTTVGTTTQPLPVLIPPGVTISGIPVGGMTPDEAKLVVTERFDVPLPLRLDRRRRLAPLPSALGATAHVDEAINRARNSQPGATLTLPVLIDGDIVRAYVRPWRRTTIARRPTPRSSSGNGSPSSSRIGRCEGEPARVDDDHRLPAPEDEPRPGPDQARGPSCLDDAERVPQRDRHPARVESPLPVPLRPPAPRVPCRDRPVDLPDALGRFTIQVMWRNPWWYPPNSRWARGQKPIPPGPNNPLGTRWMGLSSPGVGIHGTPNSASIGYSVSHGCIRMHISEAEWLFNTVDVGTTVFIVAA